MAADEKGAARGRATVAPRCTVEIDGRVHGPGAEVTLSRAEIDRLRLLGFLVSPKAADTQVTGPSVVTEPPSA